MPTPSTHGGGSPGRRQMDLPPDQVQRARELRAEGLSWSNIGARLGLHEDTMRRRIDPGFKERRTGPRVRAFIRAGGERHVTQAEAETALARVPTDTRSMSARVMGDPLPGRSALDKMRAAQPVKVGPYSPVRAERTYYLRGFLAS